MNKKAFTAEALLTRWEIRREVQNIMGKYSQSYCIKQEGIASKILEQTR